MKHLSCLWSHSKPQKYETIWINIQFILYIINFTLIKISANQLLPRSLAGSLPNNLLTYYPANNNHPLIIANNNLSENGIIIIHRHKKEDDLLPDNLNILEKKIYGLSKITFLSSN